MIEAARQHGGWTLAGLVRAVVITGISLGVGAGLGYLIAHEPAPGAGPVPVQPRLASAAELALLAPLGPGATLGDFEVTEVLPIGDAGSLRVVCERDGVGVALDVALADKDGPRPPASTGRYAIFYALRGASPEEGERLARALVAFLEHNAAAPIPPGMGPYRPGVPAPER